MSQKLDLAIKGLDTASNQLSGTPEGSFSIAKNVSITKGVAESRRGFQRLAASFSDSAARVDVLTEYQGNIIAHRGNDLKLSSFDGSKWTDYAGTFNHPDADLARIRFLQASGNLYFTSSTGIKVLDSVNGTVFSAGMPKGLDGEGEVVGSSGFLSNNSQVAYRVVWGSRDENNNLFLGAPSQRILVANAIKEKSQIVTDTFADSITAKEQSTITCDSKANTFAGGYIDLTAASNSKTYRFWMDTTGSDSAPSNPNDEILTRVDLSSVSTAIEVAAVLSSTIDAIAEFNASVSTDTVTVTNRDAGEATDVSKTGLLNAWSVAVVEQGVRPIVIDLFTALDEQAYRFWLDSTGTSPDIEEETKTLVKVDISGTTTAGEVASVLCSAIDDIEGFNATVVGDTITIENSSAGETSNISLDGAGGTWAASVVTSASSRDVELTFSVPEGISETDFYQIYRSKESLDATDEPSDELQLVFESNPNSAELTAKSVTVTDSTPTSLMRAFLYTNQSQEGISESNDEPPFAQDLAEFKGYTFFANIKRKHYLNVNLLAVGGASGLQIDDTIEIDGLTYTAKATENIANGEFALYNSGSASQNITDTAKSLVKVVNQRTSNTTIAAYYESGFSDLPGKLLLRTIQLSDSSFSVSTSNPTSWDLSSPVSDNEQYINGFSYSKYQQSEHVPYSHLEFVGSKNYPIRRILALRDSLFFLKDDGVYKLTGSGGQWSVEELDGSTKILAPESAVVVNNQIIALTDQGVVGISDVGVQVYSEPIKDELQSLIGSNFGNLKSKSFGVGYETDHKYYLFCPASSAESVATRALVFDTFTNQWTETVKSATHGFVSSTDDKLYLAQPESKHVLSERKTYTYRDYVDEELDGYTIISSEGSRIVLNTVAGLSVGDLIWEDDSTFSPIEDLDVAANAIIVRNEKNWTVGPVTVLKAIDCELEWTNIHCDNPAVDKSFNDISVLFKKDSFSIANLGFYTDVSGGLEQVRIQGSYGAGGWGLFPWGSLPWGGIIRPTPKRVTVPRNKKRGTLLSVRFSHRVGYGVWEIQGLSLQFDFISERTESD